MCFLSTFVAVTQSVFPNLLPDITFKFCCRLESCHRARSRPNSIDDPRSCLGRIPRRPCSIGLFFFNRLLISVLPFHASSLFCSNKRLLASSRHVSFILSTLPSPILRTCQLGTFTPRSLISQPTASAGPQTCSTKKCHCHASVISSKFTVQTACAQKYAATHASSRSISKLLISKKKRHRY